jgi:hypothetical protein
MGEANEMESEAMKKPGFLTATAASLLLTSSIALAQSSPGAGTSGSSNPGASPPSAGGSTSGEMQKGEGRTRKPAPERATQGKSSGERGAKETQSPAGERHGRHERGEKRNSQQEHKGDRNRRSEEPASRQDHRGKKSSTAKAGEGHEGRKSEGKRGGHASLTTKQRTKISHAVRSQHVRVENNIDFSIHVGTRVPSSIHFYTVPVEIVEVYPEYRGYHYFVAEDEIIVVNPRTREIVAVLPYV